MFYRFLKVGGVLDCRAGGRWFSTQGLKIHWHSIAIFFFQEKFLFKNSESFSTFFLSITLTTSCYPPPLTSLYKPDLKYSQAGAIFPEVPVTFLAWKAVLCLPCLHSCKIKVSIILKIIQWNYQLTKQSWLVREQGSVLLLNKYWYWNFPSGLLRNRPHERITKP